MIENEASPSTPLDIEQLYREHRRHLLRFVQRYVRHPEDAEDVVQNTFMEAVRCAPRFSGLSKPSTWLFGIALNLARNHVRRSCNTPFEPFADSLTETTIDSCADPAVLIELREIATKVEAVLAQLHPQVRTTFEAVLDGASTYEEVSQRLQIPIGTVRSRVSRVRATVRMECGGD
jgi:RNA polymerase sigma-70 factor (ECF subfamily)